MDILEFYLNYTTKS